MYSIYVTIGSFLFIINSIDGNVIRQRRQQASVPSYGNTNLQSGYNYPSNTNFYGNNLNNQGTKDAFGNPIVPTNTGNTLNNIPLLNQQQQQQQQQHHLQQPQQSLYGVNNNNPALSNPTNTLYSASGTNPMIRDANGNVGVRDANGNLIPGGSPGSSLYSASNPQIGFPANTNSLLQNKDVYNGQTNTNNNNNQYGLNSNLYPNNNNNAFSGQLGTNNNNNNPWSNPNANNQYNTNTGSSWNLNRDYNNNNNNNPNTYSNPNLNSPYFNNASIRPSVQLSLIFLLLSFVAITFFHI